jgi:hypothetical protein
MRSFSEAKDCSIIPHYLFYPEPSLFKLRRYPGVDSANTQSNNDNISCPVENTNKFDSQTLHLQIERFSNAHLFNREPTASESYFNSMVESSNSFCKSIISPSYAKIIRGEIAH